jgi:hypothetical protein
LSRLTSKRLTDQLHRRKDGTVFPADSVRPPFPLSRTQDHGRGHPRHDAAEAAEQKILRLSHFYAALSRTSAAIIRHAEPQELFQQVCQIVAELEQMQVVWIGFVDPENGGFQLVAHAGMAVPDYPHYLLTSPSSSDPSVPASWVPTGMAFRRGSRGRQRFPQRSQPQGWRDNPGVGIRSAAAFRCGATAGWSAA